MTSAQIDQMIFDIAVKNGFTPKAAKFVAGQARVETSLNGIDHSTNNFRTNNNMFGMKFAGQANATRGTLAPMSERTAQCKAGGPCKDIDYYARYKTLEDSAKDAIERYYNKTIKGIKPERLKNAETVQEFATLLKYRNYFGGPLEGYIAGITARLRRIKVEEKKKSDWSQPFRFWDNFIWRLFG